MKLKKLLSFALALAMVLAFIPALSLTASAAEEVTSIASATIPSVMTEEFDAVDDLLVTSVSDTSVADAYGWSATYSDGTDGIFISGSRGESIFCNVAGSASAPRIQEYVGQYTNGMYTDNIPTGVQYIQPSTITMGSGYGAGKEIIAVSFIAEATASWGDVALDDIDGQGITAFRMGTDGFQSYWGHDGWCSPFSSYYGGTNAYVPTSTTATTNTAAATINSGTTQITIYIEKGIPENGYTVTYYAGGSLYSTETFENKTFNGLGYIQMSKGYGNEYTRISLQNLEIYSADYDEVEAADKLTVTVNYDYKGETIDSVTSEAALSGSTVTFDAHTVTTNDGTVLTWKSAAYIVGDEDTTESLNAYSADGVIADYNFADGANDALGNYDATNQGVEFKNGIATFEGGTTSSSDVIKLPDSLMQDLDGNFSISMWVKQDSSYSYNNKSITFFDFASGSSYNRLFWQQQGTTTRLQDRGGYNDASASTSTRFVYRTAETDAMKDNWALITVSFDFENNDATAYIDGVEVTMTDGAGTWSLENTPANIYAYSSDTSSVFPNFGQNVWKNGDNPGFKGEMAAIKIYNFALTDSEAATANMDAHKTVVVSFVDGEGKEIATSETVDYFLDEAEIDVPETIVYNNVSYTFSGESTTVTTSDDTYEAKYTAVGSVYDAAVSVTADGTEVYTVPAENLVGDATITVPARTFLYNGRIYSVAAQDVAVSESKPTPALAADYDENIYAMTKVAATVGDGSTGYGGISVTGKPNASGNPAQYDDDGVALTTGCDGFGSVRKVTETFSLPTLEEGKAAFLHLAVSGIRDNKDGGSSSIRLVATGNSTVAYTTSLSDSGNGTTFSSAEYMTADITDLIKAAGESDTEISIEFGNYCAGVYLVSTDSASLNGAYEGQASYIEIVDAATVTLPSDGSYITYNGAKRTADNCEVNVVPGGSIIVYDADGNTVDAYAVDADNNVTKYTAGTAITINADTRIITDIGVTAFNGAQIRIGSGVDGEELADMSKSGLRFIATVDRTGTLAADALGGTVGLAISADDTLDDGDLCVDAVLYQDADENGNVFTVAITGIAESNYNTVYYAIPYVKFVDGDNTTYYTDGTSVPRTPYQVAAGILTSTERTDSEGYSPSTSTSENTDALYAVLNVYANKTGARLTLDVATDGDGNDTYTFGKATYANGVEAFFEVEQVNLTDDNGDVIGQTITLTANGDATFYSYWADKLRIANNHTEAIKHVDVENAEWDGNKLTFNYYYGEIPSAE